MSRGHTKPKSIMTMAVPEPLFTLEELETRVLLAHQVHMSWPGQGFASSEYWPEYSYTNDDWGWLDEKEAKARASLKPRLPIYSEREVFETLKWMLILQGEQIQLIHWRVGGRSFHEMAVFIGGEMTKRKVSRDYWQAISDVWREAHRASAVEGQKKYAG